MATCAFFIYSYCIFMESIFNFALAVNAIRNRVVTNLRLNTYLRYILILSMYSFFRSSFIFFFKETNYLVSPCSFACFILSNICERLPYSLLHLKYGCNFSILFVSMFSRWTTSIFGL